MKKYSEKLFLPFQWCHLCMRMEPVVTEQIEYEDESITVRKCKHQTVCEAAVLAKEREKAYQEETVTLPGGEITIQIDKHSMSSFLAELEKADREEVLGLFEGKGVIHLMSKDGRRVDLIPSKDNTDGNR